MAFHILHVGVDLDAAALQKNLLARSKGPRSSLELLNELGLISQELSSREIFFLFLGAYSCFSESITTHCHKSEPGSRMKPSCKRLHRQEKGYDPTPLSSTLKGSRSGSSFSRGSGCEHRGYVFPRDHRKLKWILAVLAISYLVQSYLVRELLAARFFSRSSMRFLAALVALYLLFDHVPVLWNSLACLRRTLVLSVSAHHLASPSRVLKLSKRSSIRW